MDALDQQLLTRRIDRIEHKIDKLIEILSTPPVIIRSDYEPTVEDVERIRTWVRNGDKPLIVSGEPRIEYIGPRIQAEDFEDL